MMAFGLMNAMSDSCSNVFFTVVLWSKRRKRRKRKKEGDKGVAVEIVVVVLVAVIAVVMSVTCRRGAWGLHFLPTRRRARQVLEPEPC